MFILLIKTGIYSIKYVNHTSFFNFSKKNKTLCECNQPKEAHKIQDNPENLKWSMEQNTKEKVDPRHGQLSNKSWV
jgi:hypothetical protein